MSQDTSAKHINESLIKSPEIAKITINVTSGYPSHEAAKPSVVDLRRDEETHQA